MDPIVFVNFALYSNLVFSNFMVYVCMAYRQHVNKSIMIYYATKQTIAIEEYHQQTTKKEFPHVQSQRLRFFLRSTVISIRHYEQHV